MGEAGRESRKKAKTQNERPGVTVHAHSFRTWETEAGDPHTPGLRLDFKKPISQQTKNQRWGRTGEVDQSVKRLPKQAQGLEFRSLEPT